MSASTAEPNRQNSRDHPRSRRAAHARLRSLVEARTLVNWFGPSGFTLPTCDIDFRVGGALTVRMRSPDGEEFRSKGTFREIVVPERIVLESALLDENGQPRFEDRNIISFAERDGKTVITVEANIVKLYDPTAAGAIDGMDEGWNQTLDRLAAYLAVKH